MVIICVTLIRKVVGQIELDFDDSVNASNVPDKLVKSAQLCWCAFRMNLNKAVVYNNVHFTRYARYILEY